MPTATIGLGEHGRLMTSGAKWFNTVGGLTLLIGGLQLIAAGATLARVAFFDGGPTGKTAWDAASEVLRAWPFLLLGWLLLQLRNAFDAIAALVAAAERTSK